jgi:hypothetical protein
MVNAAHLPCARLGRQARSIATEKFRPQRGNSKIPLRADIPSHANIRDRPAGHSCPLRAVTAIAAVLKITAPAMVRAAEAATGAAEAATGAAEAATGAESGYGEM